MARCMDIQCIVGMQTIAQHTARTVQKPTVSTRLHNGPSVEVSPALVDRRLPTDLLPFVTAVGRRTAQALPGTV